jgi:hypothetical protein
MTRPSAGWAYTICSRLLWSRICRPARGNSLINSAGMIEETRVGCRLWVRLEHWRGPLIINKGATPIYYERGDLSSMISRAGPGRRVAWQLHRLQNPGRGQKGFRSTIPETDRQARPDSATGSCIRPAGACFHRTAVRVHSATGPVGLRLHDPRVLARRPMRGRSSWTQMPCCRFCPKPTTTAVWTTNGRKRCLFASHAAFSVFCGTSDSCVKSPAAAGRSSTTACRMKGRRWLPGNSMNGRDGFFDLQSS